MPNQSTARSLLAASLPSTPAQLAALAGFGFIMATTVGCQALPSEEKASLFERPLPQTISAPADVPPARETIAKPQQLTAKQASYYRGQPAEEGWRPRPEHEPPRPELFATPAALSPSESQPGEIASETASQVAMSESNAVSAASTWWGVATQEAAAWGERVLWQGEGGDVTLQGVVTGGFLLLAGVGVTRWASRAVLLPCLRRARLSPGRTAVVHTVTHYGLLASVGVAALEAAGLPWTSLPVAGGAIALAVGFGSQNLLNNFLSGLILLAERPIKVGDWVEVDELHGTVEEIGVRSTRIRTADNLEIVVPNSSFLERNVVNWTRSDNLIRAQVRVGVAYGSPTADVEDTLLACAHAHEQIVTAPSPFVLFADFGDSSLVFQLHFWVEMQTDVERLRIESDLRHEIDRQFRERGVTIAFPQRDIHLATKEPLNVQVMAQPATSAFAAR